MTWTFNADLGRHTVRVGSYRLSVWQEEKTADPTFGRWVGSSEGSHVDRPGTALRRWAMHKRGAWRGSRNAAAADRLVRVT